MKRALLSIGCLFLCASTVLAVPPDDPLKSPMWGDLAKRFFADAPVVFDARVKVTVPSIVENQAQVPVTADARALGSVSKMIVFADMNPIQHVLTLSPGRAAAYISFRMKVEQSTPVRAAVLDGEGVWHVGGVFLDAAGGGCSAPAMARKDADWSETVGQAQGKLWREADGGARLRLRLRHPMDTGLAKDNTPAFFIDKLEIRTSAGEPIAALETYEPVSEDPTLTLLMRLPSTETGVDIDGRDNNGRRYRSTVPAPWRQSELAPLRPRSGTDTPC